MPYDYRYVKSKIRYWQAQLDMLEQGSYQDSYRQYRPRRSRHIRSDDRNYYSDAEIRRMRNGY